jgi:hypothetical protein
MCIDQVSAYGFVGDSNLETQDMLKDGHIFPRNPDLVSTAGGNRYKELVHGN